MGRINKGRKNEDNRGMEKNVGKGEGRKVGYRNREKKKQWGINKEVRTGWRRRGKGGRRQQEKEMESGEDEREKEKEKGERESVSRCIEDVGG